MAGAARRGHPVAGAVDPVPTTDGASAAGAFVTGMVVRHFADTVGVPIALLVIGAALIGSAVMVARLRRLTRD